MKPPDFLILETHAIYNMRGSTSFAAALQALRVAVVVCHENQIAKLLVDTRELTGFTLSLADRFDLATQVASDAMGAVKIAMVARPELIDPQRFGMTVAANRGLDANVFTDDVEALKWLLS